MLEGPGCDLSCTQTHLHLWEPGGDRCRCCYSQKSRNRVLVKAWADAVLILGVNVVCTVGFHLICDGGVKVLLKSTGWPTHRCCSANPHLLNLQAASPPACSTVVSGNTKTIFRQPIHGRVGTGRDGGRGGRASQGGSCSPAWPPKSLHDFLICGPRLRVRRLQSGPDQPPFTKTGVRW